MNVEDKLRYSRVSDILSLLTLMQSKVLGITLTDIQNELNVSRRTAERLRDAILCIFTQIDEIETDDREKHWGFTSGYLNEFITFAPDEIATLESLKETLKYKDKKQTIETIITKLKAISRKNITNVEDAIEMILKTEGVAVSQKPNYKVNLEILETIRTAIKENRKIKVLYRDKNKTLAPYGIIYGSNMHLIAMEGNSEHPYNYLIHKINKIELTRETRFVRVFNEEGKPPSFAKGVWVMALKDIEGLTPAQIKDKFALPGMPSHVVELELPSGTQLITGPCNPVEGWGRGGGTQYFITGEKSHKYSNIRELPPNP